MNEPNRITVDELARRVGPDSGDAWLYRDTNDGVWVLQVADFEYDYERLRDEVAAGPEFDVQNHDTFYTVSCPDLTPLYRVLCETGIIDEREEFHVYGGAE